MDCWRLCINSFADLAPCQRGHNANKPASNSGNDTYLSYSYLYFTKSILQLIGNRFLKIANPNTKL